MKAVALHTIESVPTTEETAQLTPQHTVHLNGQRCVPIKSHGHGHLTFSSHKIQLQVFDPNHLEMETPLLAYKPYQSRPWAGFGQQGDCFI